MPRAFNASAISRSVVAPAFLISRMIGSTLAAWLPAAAPMVSKATFRAWASFRTAWLQVGDERFNSTEIQRLYEADDYPLRKSE